MALHFDLLIIDDSEDDAMLIVRTLKKGGMRPACKHVKNERELRNVIEQREFDVVISDHNMPSFSSHEAIQIVKARYPDTPVIVVSGTMCEDMGVEAMKLGAQDYVMKDRLARLIPALERELALAANKKVYKETERNLEFLSFHDTLTSLLNRKEFERRLEEALTSPSDETLQHVLLQLDLDQFKLVNDTCGHIAGDELLRQITQLLKRHVRENDSLARLGGDEFGLLLQDISQDAAFAIAKRIGQEIRDHRFIWNGSPFSISASIGMIAVHAGLSTASDLLSSVDIACHAAKEKGRDGIQWYSRNDAELNYRRNEMQWASRIKKALENDSFVLFSQPMQTLKSSLEGLHQEFLIRLNDEGDLVPPGAFIPAAERYNLMPLIDRWVIHNIFKYLSATGRGQLSEGTYFINLSGNSLSDSSFFEDIYQLAKQYEVIPNRICFEITETAAIANLADAVEFIEDIRSKGFKFALDDFGVGMSSFSYLKTIPVDYLKIDGSFVKNLLRDPIDRGIVEACNGIAHAAKLKTIAEFVENDETLQALKFIGVDYAQGFGIAKPGPLDWSNILTP
ncbi:MAG: EAL domain-containing protein [Hahellaceae bacterium]|nr:EAL domain-containing protein [Hahellaceae bacterium]